VSLGAREHTPHVCTPKCDSACLDEIDERCTVCGTASPHQPTECPGMGVSTAVQFAIVRGELDFVDGEWKRLT